MYWVKQAEYGVQIRLAASQEYVVRIQHVGAGHA